MPGWAATRIPEGACARATGPAERAYRRRCLVLGRFGKRIVKVYGFGRRRSNLNGGWGFSCPPRPLPLFTSPTLAYSVELRVARQLHAYKNPLIHMITAAAAMTPVAAQPAYRR
jgi:hypothetical protein